MKKGKKLIQVFIAIFFALGTNSCGDEFLTQKPLATLNPKYVVDNAEGIEMLLVGAYALLDGFAAGVGDGSTFKAHVSNWTFGSIAGGEATKGSDATDQPSINDIQAFGVTPTNEYVRIKWQSLYAGISAANVTIKRLNELPEAAIAPAARTRILAEARALRGFFHLEAKKMWDDILYLDETTDPAKATNVGDNDTWALIEADFQHATDNLLASVPAKGRWNKWAAKAFLGKVQLYRKNYTAAEATLQDVYSNGVTTQGVKYALNPQFRQAFNGNNDNSAESVMAVQYTGNDGSAGVNASSGEVLNFPHNGGYGAATSCCGFFQPTHDFVNSFRTVGGLPLLDGSYNTAAYEVKSDETITGSGSLSHLASPPDNGTISNAIYVPDGGTLDPRLDWTVGRRGVPYLDWGIHPGKAWIRDINNSGPFSPKKHVFNKADVGTYTDPTGWTAGYATNNYYLMRFSDLILLLAETKIENNKLSEALALVNEVRNRAANPAGFVPGSPASYSIQPYTAFADQNEARAAVRMERKLELGMEGHRFFDLVRWGVANAELNTYLTYEKKWRSALLAASFAPGEDEYYPIPQRQIDLMLGMLVQNSYHD
jgi:starch-binding outer membrane protein, SusD/RagB family